MLFNFHYWAGFGDDGETFLCQFNYYWAIWWWRWNFLCQFNYNKLQQQGATSQITSGFGQNARNSFHSDGDDDDDDDDNNAKLSENFSQWKNDKYKDWCSISKVVTLFNLFSGGEFMLLRFNLSFLSLLHTKPAFCE